MLRRRCTTGPGMPLGALRTCAMAGGTKPHTHNAQIKQVRRTNRMELYPVAGRGQRCQHVQILQCVFHLIDIHSIGPQGWLRLVHK